MKGNPSQAPATGQEGLREAPPPPALDTLALVRALCRVTGRRFLGVVDGLDCLELVYEGEHGRNLITVYTEGWRAGRVSFGGLDSPEGYAEQCRMDDGDEWLRWRQ